LKEAYCEHDLCSYHIIIIFDKAGHNTIKCYYCNIIVLCDQIIRLLFKIK
jgi:hypothetical protein